MIFNYNRCFSPTDVEYRDDVDEYGDDYGGECLITDKLYYINFSIDFKHNRFPFGSKLIGKSYIQSDFGWFSQNQKLISLRVWKLFVLSIHKIKYLLVF